MHLTTQGARRPTTRRGLKLAAPAALGACLLIASAVPAWAQSGPGTPEQLRVNAAGVRVGPEGLRFVRDLLPGLLPQQIAVDDLSKDVYDCPAGRKITMNLSQASADLKLNSLDASLGDQSIDVDVNVDVAARGHVRVDNAYVCYGTLECDVGFSLRSLNLGAKLGVAATQGDLAVALNDVLLSLTPDDLEIDVSGCAVDGVIEGFASLAKSFLFDHARTILTRMLQEKVPPLVEEKLQSLIGRTGNLLGFDYRLALGDVAVSPQGLDAYLSLGLAYNGPEAACLPGGDPGPAPDSGSLVMGQGPSSPFVLGVSTAFLGDALRAAWRSGLLCLDDAKLGALGFNPAQLNLAQAVPGLLPGTELHFKVVLGQPPTLTTMGDASGGTVALGLNGAELRLQLGKPGASVSEVVVSLDAVLAVRPGVDPVTGTIGLELADLALNRLQIASGASDAAAFNLDPARLEQLVKDFVLPLAANHLGRIPLAPTAFGALGYFVTVDQVLPRPEGLYVGVEVFRAPAEDGLAPTTALLEKPSPVTRPGLVRFLVSGADDQTPEKLLRYAWQIDDGPISEPTFAREIRVPVTAGGVHVFKVVAIDLNNNVDPQPQTFTFELDPVPPTLQIVSAPATLHPETFAVLKVAGADDRTPASELRYSYRVEEALPGGANQIRQETQPAPLTGDIRIDNLIEGGVYTVTVMVHDVAGNVSSQKVSFTVHGEGGGCAVAVTAGGHTGSATPLALLGLLGLLVLAVRRRRP